MPARTVISVAESELMPSFKAIVDIMRSLKVKSVVENEEVIRFETHDNDVILVKKR